MNWLSGLKQIVKRDVPLAQYTWYGLGGPAKYFIEPRSIEELAEVVTRCRENGVAMYVLGGGANLLVDDKGVNGAVIHLSQKAFREMTFNQDGVTVGAGLDMGRVVLRCVRKGMSGLEPLAGIPGTVGGCVRMNAGGAFGDCGTSVLSVTVMNNEGEIFQRYRDDLAFAYRSTNINSKFILQVSFELVEDDPQRLLRDTKQIWIYKKNTQPISERSAGCVFKNPRGMSAGALIDKAGLKGRRIGGATISPRHANFIVVEKGATAFDVMKLIDLIRETVAQDFDVMLERELEIW